MSVVEHPENSAVDQRGAIRARRTRLQEALLARVPEGIIKYSKKLVHLDDLSDEGVRLTFADGTEVVADIVVGADGIHSVSSRISFSNEIFQTECNFFLIRLLEKASFQTISFVLQATRHFGFLSPNHVSLVSLRLHSQPPGGGARLAIFTSQMLMMRLKIPIHYSK